MLLELAQFYDLAQWGRAEADYVKRHGIDMGAVNAHAGVLAIVPCTFDGRGRFCIEGPDEEPGVVIECLGDDAATTVDLVAWPIEEPETFATLGGFDALGMAQVGNPASYAFKSALQVHRTPLKWLQAGCRGCVILHHQHITCWLGHALGAIMAEDVEHARLLDRLLNPRFDKSRILVPRKVESRAA